MSENNSDSDNKAIRPVVDKERERPPTLDFREILKREHEDRQKFMRNIALEKWGPVIEEQIKRSFEARRRSKVHGKDNMDLDME
jgi:hypothetical protein